MPGEFDIQLLLAYAYLESEQHDRALAQLETLAKANEPWPLELRNGFRKIPGAGTGFMLLRRAVPERMVETAQETITFKLPKGLVAA